MAKPRTTLVEFTEHYRCLGNRYNPGDIVRLPRRLARTLVQNRRANLAADGSAETGSTVTDLHATTKAGRRPKRLKKGKAAKPVRETKADAVPEAKAEDTSPDVPNDAQDASVAEMDPEPATGETTVADVIAGLGSMTLIQLREACRNNGIATGGGKAKLVARLKGHLLRSEG